MDDSAWDQLNAKQREALVHRVVFGHDIAGEAGERQRGEKHWRPGDAHAHIPHYSRDIRAAWMIVDRLYQLAPEAGGPSGSPQCHVHLLGDGRVWTALVDVGNGRTGEAEAESVCEALCLAALRLLAPAPRRQSSG